MYLSKNDKRNINRFLFAILIVAFCFCISGYTAAYVFTEKDTVSDETKFYFLENSFKYFEDNPEKANVRLDYLMKLGYIKVQDDMMHCYKDNSYIEKENDVYFLHINCGSYSSTMKIQRKEEY